ncbi:MAG: ABC transporter ATP-binding protein [Cyanobacteria bacterium P01_G01_bin.49]
MAKVTLENIHKSFPKRGVNSQDNQVKVLQDINLEINDGEFMVLVGPSGCGKSTLLRLMAGLETATWGEIWVNSQKITHFPPKQRDIAMVFQNYALYPHLNVYDNLAFGLRRMNQGMQPKNPSIVPKEFGQGLGRLTQAFPKPLRYYSAVEEIIDQKIQQVAQLLQIAHLLYRLPKDLSGGQKQRVALGRAIARNPQVFLMDEPMSNLDATLRTETRSQIVQLQRELGITTIYVTHDQIEAMTMGDRIAIMNQGKIQQVASPSHLYNYPENCFVAGFIGSPPMNFLPVTLDAPLRVIHQQFNLNLPEVWQPYLKNHYRKSATLGIRPEHLTLSSTAPENIPVKVNLVENLGHENYIFTQIKDEIGSQIIVRIPSGASIKVGDDLWLSLSLEKIHLFDSGTETSLLSMNS